MNKLPLISIVMPTHNSAATVKQTLSSILELEYPKDKLELIIVDDKSTDETPSILESFATQYERSFYSIKLLRFSERLGLSRARNEGLLNSSGEYILFLDSDVKLRKQTLLDFLEILESKENCGAVSGIYVHNPPSLIEKMVLNRYLGGVKEGPLFTGATLVPRWVVKNVGLFNEKLGYPHTVYEDWEYQVRMQKLGLKVLVDGRNILTHLSKEERSQDEARAHRFSGVKHMTGWFASYFSFRKASALYEVLKHAPCRLRFEYLFYASLALLTPVLLYLNFMASLALWFIILVSTTVYYLNEYRFRNARYALLLGIVTLASRFARAATLTAYILYRKIQGICIRFQLKSFPI